MLELKKAKGMVEYWTKKDKPQYAENWQVRVEQLVEQSVNKAKRLRAFAALKPCSEPAKYCIEVARKLEMIWK